MKILVLTWKHGLTPFAWRMKSSGDHEVELLVSKLGYRKAWKGRFGDVRAADKKGRSDLLHALRDELAERAGETTVLTDSLDWTKFFRDAHCKGLYGRYREARAALGPLRLGSWFDGEEHTARHLLVADEGLFPGGGGSPVTSGLTLVAPLRWPEPFEAILQATSDELKSAGFRGLVQVGLSEGEGGLQGGEWEAGWPWLQSHAFVALQPSLANVLAGEEPKLPMRFTVASALSIPPWPLPGARPPASVPVELPEDPAVRALVGRSTFYHDIVIGDDRLKTAGLDGLVGVVFGSGFHLGTALARMRTARSGLGVAQAQWRSDAGLNTERVLVGLEAAGIFV